MQLKIALTAYALAVVSIVVCSTWPERWNNFMVATSLIVVWVLFIYEE